MKLHTEKRELQSNITGQQKFTIDDTAKAFETLSNTLYSNKIRAIVRELSTNAYDSHVENGNPEQPFIIELPNELEPKFAVEDFGTGMEEEKVLGTYSCYFSSDKSDTNTQTGVFGLGSKSPFSYTDNFTVTSWFNKEKKVYLCSKDENDIPNIVKVFEEKSSREPGVRIELAIKKEDFYNFKNETESVLRPFTHKPKITGIVDLEIQKYEEVILRNGIWEIFKDNHRGRYNNKVLALQGNIEYVVNFDEFKKNLDKTVYQKYSFNKEQFEKMMKFFGGINCKIDFPIGAIAFTTDRERLKYTSRTSENLFAKLIDIYSDIKIKITECFKETDNKIDLILKYYTYSRHFKSCFDFNELKIDGVPFLNKAKISDNYVYGKDYVVFTFVSNGSFRSDEVTRCVMKTQTDFVDMFNENLSRDQVKVIYHNQQETDATTRSGVYRVRQHVKHNKFFAVLVYNKTLLTELNEIDYTVTTDYPHIKKSGTPSSLTSSKEITKFEFKIRFNGAITSGVINKKLSDCINDKDFENKDNIYVTKYRKTYQTDGVKHGIQKISYSDICRQVEILHNLKVKAGKIFNPGDTFLTVYVLKKGDTSRKDIRGFNWIYTKEYFYNELNAVVLNPTVKSFLKEYELYHLHKNKDSEVTTIGTLFSNTILAKYEKRLKILVDKLTISTNCGDISIPCSWWNFKSELHTADINVSVDKKFNKLCMVVKKMYNSIIQKKYPMIEFIRLNTYRSDTLVNDNKNVINSYVELVNKNL